MSGGRSSKKERAAKVSVGDTFPEGLSLQRPGVECGLSFTPCDLSAHFSGKKCLLVGLPGAFTPTCSSVQIPGYLEKEQLLKDEGIDEVVVFCVNDAAVMKAWSEQQGVAGSKIITFMGDPASEVTKGLDMVFANIPLKLGYPRCKRFAMYIDDNTVKAIEVSESEEDPAGDGIAENSCVDNMLKHVKACNTAGNTASGEEEKQ